MVLAGLLIGVLSLALASPASADMIIQGSDDSTYRVSGVDTFQDVIDQEGTSATFGSTGCSVVPNNGPGPAYRLSGGCSATDVRPGETLEEAEDRLREAREGKPWALIVFDFAIQGDRCLSCDFLAYFMVGLADFSILIYQYFYNAFLILVPMVLLLWIGWRVAKMMVMGGEDGKQFLYEFVSKTTLFVFLWLIALGSGTAGNKFLWTVTGPLYLDYSFRLSNELRTYALTATSGADTTNLMGSADAGSPLLCEGVGIPPAVGADVGTLPAEYAFVTNAMKVGCATERVHVMGIATGVSVSTNAFSATDINFIRAPRDSAIGVFTALIRLALGVFIIVVYGLSALWLIFLILDVVVRGMITAAFSPLLLGLFLLQATRSVTINAVKAVAGAFFTSIAIAVVGILAFVLITNTVDVYNNSHELVEAGYDNYGGDLSPIGSSDPVAGMRELIQRVGETPENNGIPMDFGAPWTWYLMFVGIAVFALGKKMIMMLEGLIGAGASQLSAFADSALKATRMGAGAGSLAAGATAVAGTFAASRVAAPGAMALGGAMAQQNKSMIKGAGGALNWAGERLGTATGNKRIMRDSGMLGAGGGPSKGAMAAGGGAMKGMQETTTDK